MGKKVVIPELTEKLAAALLAIVKPSMLSREINKTFPGARFHLLANHLEKKGLIEMFKDKVSGTSGVMLTTLGKATQKAIQAPVTEAEKKKPAKSTKDSKKPAEEPSETPDLPKLEAKLNPLQVPDDIQKHVLELKGKKQKKAIKRFNKVVATFSAALLEKADGS